MENFISLFKDKIVSEGEDNITKIVAHMNRRDSTLIGKNMLKQIQDEMQKVGNDRESKLKAVENFQRNLKKERQKAATAVMNHKSRLIKMDKRIEDLK